MQNTKIDNAFTFSRAMFVIQNNTSVLNYDAWQVKWKMQE